MPEKTDRDLFKKLCYCEDDYSQAHLLNTLSINKITFILANWEFSSKTCRGCSWPILKENDFAIWVTYWRSILFPSHKGCLDLIKEEAYECQKIDADCNDCGHFKREKGLHGLCLKKNVPMVARPVFASGYECFVHRLDLIRQKNETS